MKCEKIFQQSPKIQGAHSNQCNCRDVVQKYDMYWRNANRDFRVFKNISLYNCGYGLSMYFKMHACLYIIFVAYNFLQCKKAIQHDTFSITCCQWVLSSWFFRRLGTLNWINFFLLFEFSIKSLLLASRNTL